MPSAPPCLFKVLGVVVVAMTIMGTAESRSWAQESTSQRLERVEVNPPERRTRAAPARTGQDSGYDDTEAQDRQPSDAASDQGDRSTGAPSAMPSLAVVADKGSVSSVSAASLPAQVQEVTRQDIDRLDVRNYTDLFRQVPGVRSYTYGNGEIGHPFSMRGFSGGHGSDVAVYVDGVPQNFPSSVVSMNGASDISWLAPEMIDKIEVIKGPFSPFYGNQAQAGAINIKTKNSEPRPSLTISAGSYGSFRTVPIITSESLLPIPFLAYEYTTLEGYRDNSQYRRLSPFNKVTLPLWGSALSFRFNLYRSDWGRPGYISINEVKTGIKKRTAVVNPSDGGDQRTWSFVVNYAPVDRDWGLYADAYVEKFCKHNYSMSMPNPQQLSIDDRIFYGGRIYYNFVFGNLASLVLGAETRYDKATEQKFKTLERHVTSTSQDYELGLLNTSLFAQLQFKVADSVKIVGGARKDYFEDVVENRVKPANSGKGYPHTFNPKVGFVLTPTKNINVFGNKGVGFRAPGMADLSPTSGNKAFDLSPAKTESWDLGFNGTFLDKLYFALDWYQTDMENEVRTMGEQVLNIGSSQRNGYEVEARWYASDQISLFANYSWVEAKVKNPSTAGQDLVTGVPEDMIKAGIQMTYDLAPTVKFLGDLYCEYVGEQPYYFGTSATPQYGPDYVMYNIRTAWQGRNWGLFVSAKYNPKEYSSDTVYTENNKLVFNPLPVWNLSSGFKYTF